IERAYPSVDYDDLMAGVDTVVNRGYIDTQRLYVGGCSGGGVLSSWVIGHTTRFAAAAVRCPVIDWMSMAGETDVPLFTYGFFDAPFWEKPEQWIKQSSLADRKSTRLNSSHGSISYAVFCLKKKKKKQQMQKHTITVRRHSSTHDNIKMNDAE